MTEQEAIRCLDEQIKLQPCGNVALAFELAINALEKQIELRKNCEGSCSDYKYRGEFHCANDLLIDSEV